MASNVRVVMAASVVALGLASQAFSQTWNVDASSNWNTASNWNPATVPNAIDAAVTFGPVVTAGRTVTLNVNATVGSIVFNEDSVGANAYSVAFNTNQVLTFDVTSGNAVLNGRGSGGYQIGTQGNGSSITLNDNLTISAGNAQSATGDSASIAINSRLTGNASLTVSSLNSNDGTGTAVNGNRGTFLRSSTLANSFTGGVTVNSGYLGLGGNIGNLGTGTLTLNASDSSNGGIGTTFRLRTSGGTLTNNIVFGNSGATGGGSPRLGIFLQDGAARDYVSTGSISGSIGNQQMQFQARDPGGVSTASTLTLSGDGSGLTVGTNGSVYIRNGSIILNNANALASGNTVGTTSSGGWILGDFSNNAAVAGQLLTNGFNVGGRITTNAATSSGNTNNDNIVVGGIHTTGTATFSTPITINKIVSGSRKFQLTSAAGGTTVFSGGITEGGAFGSNVTSVLVEKVGAGTVVLSGSSNYVAGTTVVAGTLLVNNTTGSATGTGAVTVNASALLGGTGSISGNVNVNALGGIVSTTAVDALSIGGLLTIDPSAVLDLTALSGLNPSLTYDLITYGSRSNTQFGTVLGQPGTHNLVYGSLTSGAIQLVPVPEPSALAILGLAGLGALRRHRRQIHA